MKLLYAILLPAALLLNACVTEYFTLNEGMGNTLYGEILSKIDSVDIVRNRLLVVHSGGKAAMRDYEITQCRWLLQSTLKRGEETIYRLRTVPIEFYLTPSVDVFISTSGCRVEQQGRVLAVNDTVRVVPGVPEKIEFINDGNLFTVTVGCTRIFQGPVSLPSTEWLVVESPSGSEVECAQVQTEETR
jgi:hypothetical protein